MGKEIENYKRIKFFTDYNLAYIILSQIIVFITGFIKLPLYSNIFSPTDIGNYSLITSSLNYIDIILLSWVSSSFWRFIYDIDSKRYLPDLLSIIFPILGVLFVSGFIIVFLLGTFVFQFQESLSLFILGFLSIILQQVTSLFYMVLQSKNKIKMWCLGLIAQNIFSLVLFVLLVIFWKEDLKSIFLSTIIINLLLIVFGYRFFRISFNQGLINREKNKSFNSLLTYSIQSTIVNILLVVLINADRFIISNYKGARITGIYSQIYSVAFVGFYFVIQAFTNILLPYFNKATIINSDKPYDSYIIKLFLIIFTPACIFLIINSKEIIYLVLSKSYQEHYEVFSWVVAGIYFYGLANFYEIRLKLLNKINLVTIMLIFIALLNISSNLFMLKDHEVKWAAIITFISYAAFLAFVLFFNRRVLIKLNIKQEAIWLLMTSFFLVLCQFSLKLILTDLNPIFSLLISFSFLVLAYLFLLNKTKPIFLYCFKMLENKNQIN